MDPNWIMAIIAFCAIFSPAIVSIVDNKFKYKTKKLELDFPNKQKALSEFVNQSMNFYLAEFYNDTVEYIKAKNNLFIYFNIESSNLFTQLENYARDKDFENYKETINIIVKRLSEQLNTESLWLIHKLHKSR